MNAITELIFYIYGTIGVLFMYLVSMVLALAAIFWFQDWLAYQFKAIKRDWKFLTLGKRNELWVVLICLFSMPVLGIGVFYALTWVYQLLCAGKCVVN